jgi:hypothetical protein
MTPFEAVIASKLIEQGYSVLTSGWPDFCAVKQVGDVVEVRFIEVKGRGDVLRPSQQKLHKILRILGMDVEVIQEDANHRMQYPPSLASGVTVVKKHLTGRPPIKGQIAIPFLREELRDGPKASREIIRKAFDLGVSRGTIYRYAKDMQIVSKRSGTEIVWELPTQSEEPKS